MQRIVVGVDGSDSSRRALEWAAGVACGTTLELVVERVLGPLADGVGTAVDPAIECTRQLAAWCAALPDRTLHHETIVARGDPASILLEEAAQPGTELLVVASRGAGEGAGLHIGTVVRRVARRVTIPLAIVGPTAGTTTTRLVVGHHPRTSNAGALAFTTEVARRMKIPVTAVQTMDPGTDGGTDADGEERQRRARAELEEWSVPITAAGVECDYDGERVRGGDPVAGLERALAGHPGAVAVVGVRDTDGRRADRIPLGLVRHSHHTVILVPDTPDPRPFGAVATERRVPSLD